MPADGSLTWVDAKKVGVERLCNGLQIVQPREATSVVQVDFDASGGAGHA